MREPKAGVDLDAPLRPPGTLAVRPRRAATLILVRDTTDGPLVLMGRRSGGHDFMPNKWVFPGGRVDPTDHAGPAASELRETVVAAIAAARRRRSPPGQARAFALAAVRETFEEAGLLLGAPWREPVRARASGGGPWAAFLERGAAPDLAALSLLGRAVTPVDRPKRFDALFFTAAADRLFGGEDARRSAELDEIGWFSIPQALTLDLPTVTRMMIAEVERRRVDPSRPPLVLAGGAMGGGVLAGGAPRGGGA